jgi:hypothetical protein
VEGRTTQCLDHAALSSELLWRLACDIKQAVA